MDCTSGVPQDAGLQRAACSALLRPTALPPRCPVERLGCLFKNPICDSLGMQAACFSMCLRVPTAQQSCLNPRCPAVLEPAVPLRLEKGRSSQGGLDQACRIYSSSAGWGRATATQCPQPGREGHLLNPARSLRRDACGVARAGTPATPAGIAKSTSVTDEVTGAQPDHPPICLGPRGSNRATVTESGH